MSEAQLMQRIRQIESELRVLTHSYRELLEKYVAIHSAERSDASSKHDNDTPEQDPGEPYPIYTEYLDE